MLLLAAPAPPLVAQQGDAPRTGGTRQRLVAGGAWWSAVETLLEEPGASGATCASPAIQELPIERWDDTRRTLRVATLAGLWTTGALGTLVAINRPTLLGDGRCGLGGDPVLGDYVLSRFPEVIGIRSAGTREDFSKVLRTIHAGVGSLTVLAYTITF